MPLNISAIGSVKEALLAQPVIDTCLLSFLRTVDFIHYVIVINIDIVLAKINQYFSLITKNFIFLCADTITRK